MVYPDGEYSTKIKIRSFMKHKRRAITPEIIPKFIYRSMSIEEAEEILEDMVENDEYVLKSTLEDGTFTYYYKYIKRKRYY